MLMKLVVILLPISSSSKDAIRRMSSRISGLRKSMISARFSLLISCSTSAAVSVSSSEITPAAL